MTVEGHRPPRDAGLQSERTALAWMRTALAVLVNGALLVRTGIDNGEAVVLVVGVLLLGLGGAVAVFSRLRARALLAVRRTSAPATMMMIATVLVTAAAVTAALFQ